MSLLCKKEFWSQESETFISNSYKRLSLHALSRSASIDLSQMEPEVTHTIEQELEDGAGTISLLLTISGTAGSETISDLANYTPNPLERQQLVSRYVSLFPQSRPLATLNTYSLLLRKLRIELVIQIYLPFRNKHKTGAGLDRSQGANQIGYMAVLVPISRNVIIFLTEIEVSTLL